MKFYKFVKNFRAKIEYGKLAKLMIKFAKNASNIFIFNQKASTSTVVDGEIIFTKIKQRKDHMGNEDEMGNGLKRSK